MASDCRRTARTTSIQLNLSRAAYLPIAREPPLDLPPRDGFFILDGQRLTNPPYQALPDRHPLCRRIDFDCRRSNVSQWPGFKRGTLRPIVTSSLPR